MTSQEDEAAPAPEAVGDQDPILVLFLRMTAKELQPTITLMVGGLLVSGTLVGHRDYLAGIANQFRTATSKTPGIGPAIASGVETAVAELDAQGPDDESIDEAHPGFIHLKDVRIRGQQGTLPDVPWWRGRLAAVDGFFFGTPT